MPGRLRNVLSMLLDLVPTLVALTVLGAVAWWGYELLTKQSEEDAQSKEEKKETESPEKGLPLVKLASEEALKTAGITPERIEEELVGEYVEAHGDIDFDQDHYAHLSTRASGTAWRVFKHAGDEVKQGEVLALIASPEVARLKFDLEQTLLSVQTRERIYERLKGAGTSAATKDRDSAEASLREARIRLSNDQQSLLNLGLSVSVEELTHLSDEQVAARLRTLGIPDSLLQDVDPSTLTSNLLPMFAPFNSVVIKRDIVIGEVVNPGTPQFVLADLSRLWIMLHVHQEDVGKLDREQPVSFRVDASKEDAPPAKISWISAQVDEKTRTVLVRADVDNPKGRLRPNAFGDGRILVRQEKRVTVPNEALQTVSNATLQTVTKEALPFGEVSHVVFARGESATEFQPLRVTLGPRHEKFTEIRSGLGAGQTIAVSGTRKLLAALLKERIAGED
jgi:membrane fusion protein, heavy metal efflux system